MNMLETYLVYWNFVEKFVADSKFTQFENTLLALWIFVNKSIPVGILTLCNFGELPQHPARFITHEASGRSEVKILERMEAPPFVNGPVWNPQ